MSYDKDDTFEVYWGCQHSVWELFTLADPHSPASMRALAEKLLAEIGPTDDQPLPHASELALLLAANAHAYQREFQASYGVPALPLSWEEQECVRRGWDQPTFSISK